MKTIKISITETACSSPKNIDESYTFNRIEEHFETIEEAKDYLFERYGKKDFSKNRKVFQGEEEIGFTQTFWNKDISHDSKSWFQTDWIITTKQTETPINLFK